MYVYVHAYIFVELYYKWRNQSEKKILFASFFLDFLWLIVIYSSILRIMTQKWSQYYKYMYNENENTNYNIEF